MKLNIKLIHLSYSLLLYLLAPLVIIRLWLRSLKLKGYRQRISERFGYGAPCNLEQPTLWIHAVSVGEVNSAIILINFLQSQNYWRSIVLTTMTPTGAERVAAVSNHNILIVHRYVPYDLPDAVNRFINKIKPRLLIIIETEIWPNLIHACYKRNIPVVIGNARLSERSLQGYRYLSFLISNTLAEINFIAAQSQLDAERFKQIGAYPERIKVTGNIKFDLKPPDNLKTEILALQKLLPSPRRIWIAASTHQGEEEIVLAAHSELRRVINNVLLILVPRHPERFAQVTKLCEKFDFHPVDDREKKGEP